MVDMAKTQTPVTAPKAGDVEYVTYVADGPKCGSCREKIGPLEPARRITHEQADRTPVVTYWHNTCFRAVRPTK